MLAAAVALAIAYWGPSADCQIAVHVRDLPRGVLGRTYYNPGDWCEIQIDARWWTWGELCSAVLHEDGHAHGLPHAPDGVMAPVLVGTLEPCRGKRPARFKPGARILLR